MQERFLKWVFGVEKRIPGYLVKKEIQREMMRSRAGRRAWSFEERLDMGKGSELARACRKEIRERALGGRDVSKWERERRQFF